MRKYFVVLYVDYSCRLKKKKVNNNHRAILYANYVCYPENSRLDYGRGVRRDES